MATRNISFSQHFVGHESLKQVWGCRTVFLLPSKSERVEKMKASNTTMPFHLILVVKEKPCLIIH